MIDEAEIQKEKDKIAKDCLVISPVIWSRPTERDQSDARLNNPSTSAKLDKKDVNDTLHVARASKLKSEFLSAETDKHLKLDKSY